MIRLLFLDRVQSQQELEKILPIFFGDIKENKKMNFEIFKEITETNCSDIFLTFLLLFREQIHLQKHLELIFQSEIIHYYNFNASETQVSTPKHLSKMTPIHKIIDKTLFNVKKQIVRTPRNSDFSKGKR